MASLDAQVNWLALKEKNSLAWRVKLYQKTLEYLKAANDLSDFNDAGCFHWVEEQAYFEDMRKDIEKTGAVPGKWISKGHSPGIWTALFSPHNTFNQKKANTPFLVCRFYFKEGYSIYDLENKVHEEHWQSWKGKESQNEWADAMNAQGDSLSLRIKRIFTEELPHHKKFFEEKKFGAAIGYSDYASLVILLEDCIKSVEFLDLTP
jgi:enolase